MKKMLLLFATGCALLFTGCSKDDNGSTYGWRETNHIVHVTLQYEEDVPKGPEGDVFFFNLNRAHITDYTPYLYLDDDYVYRCYLRDVNNEFIFPTYQHKISPSKDFSTGKYINKSVAMALWRELGYYTQTKANVYMVIRIDHGAIDANNEKKDAYYTKLMEITENDIFKKTIPLSNKQILTKWD